MFFDCCVEKALWAFLVEITNISGEWSYEFVATFWLSNKKHLLTKCYLCCDFVVLMEILK